jgi:hypothetical protein
MQLTAEQRQVVEAARGKPVEVIDPETTRAYVLLSAELYERLRHLVEREKPEQGLGAQATPGPVVAARERPVRMKVRALPMPPEVADVVKKHCRKLGFWRRKYVRQVEDELMLQYHFGGKYVAYLRSEEGPIVVAAGDPGSEAFGRQLDALTPEERGQVAYLVPSVWNDQVSELRTPFANES